MRNNLTTNMHENYLQNPKQHQKTIWRIDVMTTMRMRGDLCAHLHDDEIIKLRHQLARCETPSYR